MAEETLPIRIVETTTTTNEVGQRVSVIPARYVDADVAVDETGNAITTVPFEEVDGLITTNSAGQAVPVIPVRIVEGLTALSETGASVGVLALRGAGGTPTPPITRTSAVHLLNNSAVRTWYNYPNLLVAAGLLYAGSVSATGSVEVTQTDGIAPTTFNLSNALQVDDHNEATLLKLPGGKLACFYSKHGGDGLVRSRVSSNALPDISAFAAERSFTDGTSCSYTAPFLLSDGVVRLFYREGAGSEKVRKMAKAPAADVEAGTETFALSTIFRTAGQRPYLTPVQNGADRVDFFVSNGHPNEVATSLYHVYMQLVGGVEKFFKSDGTEIVGLPIDPTTQGTLIDDTTGGRVWNDKIAIGPDGHPRVLFMKYPTGTTGANSGTTYNDIEYWHGRWTGSAWVKTRLLTGQKSLYPTEAFYHGGMAFDGNDVAKLYLSEIVSSIYELKSYSFNEATGVKTLVTSYTTGSATHNIRPQSPVGVDRPYEITWLDGTYTTFASYQTKMRGAGAVAVNVGAFTPAEMFTGGQLGSWHDFSDLATMSQTSGGALGNVAVGNPVGRVEDKSGNGKHLIQATAGNRPILQQDGAGKYYFDWNGAKSLSVAGFDLSSVDGCFICAGVRKGSDAAANTIAELTATSTSNNGAIALWAPSSAAPNFGFRHGGTTRPVAVAAGYAQPITAVVSGYGDVSSAFVGLRVNGALVAADTTTQGTGNLANSTLYVGARAGSSNFLTGRIYGLVIRAGRPTNEQIAKCDAWMNGKTAAY